MTPHPRSFGYARTRTRQSALAAAAIAAALLLAACSSGGGTPSKTSVESASTSAGSAPASASTSPTPSAADKAKTQVLAAYQGFWNTQVQAYTQGSFDGVQVEKYTRGNADYLLRTGLQYYVDQGLVMRGRPSLTPSVSALNLAGKLPTATITDCVDTTNYFPVDKTTGKPAKLTSTSHRHPGSYAAVYEGGQWWITDGSINRAKTC